MEKAAIHCLEFFLRSSVESPVIDICSNHDWCCHTFAFQSCLFTIESLFPLRHSFVFPFSGPGYIPQDPLLVFVWFIWSFFLTSWTLWMPSLLSTFRPFLLIRTGAFGLPPLSLHVPWQKGTGHGYGGGKDSGLHESTLRSVFSHQQIVDTLEPILKLPGQYVLVSCNQGYHRTPATCMLVWIYLYVTRKH